METEIANKLNYMVPAAGIQYLLPSSGGNETLQSSYKYAKYKYPMLQ